MFAMMAMVVVSTSCGDDDDEDSNDTTSKSPIVGKCFYLEDGEEEEWSELITDAISFNDNGSFVELWCYAMVSNGKYEAGESNGTYYVEDSNVIISFSDGSGSDTLRFTQSGNSIVLMGLFSDVPAKAISYSEAHTKYESFKKDHGLKLNDKGYYSK